MLYPPELRARNSTGFTFYHEGSVGGSRGSIARHTACVSHSAYNTMA